METVAVILVHHHNIKITWQCVESLINSDYNYFNIIIIDNSIVETDLKTFQRICLEENLCFEILEKNSNNLKFNRNIYWHQSLKNLGYAGGMNLGAQMANESTPSFLLFLNNDTIIAQRFLSLFLSEVQAIANRKDFGLAGCLIRSWPDKKIWFAGGKINFVRCMGEHFTSLPKNMEVQETGFLTGCCLFCRPQIYQELSGMDERFFLYHEDVDLCYRVVKSGYKLFFFPRVELYHQVSSSTGGDETSLAVYYSTRNRFWLMRKHFKGFVLFHFYFFFFCSRLLKTSKWIVLGKTELIIPLLKGMKTGLAQKIKAEHPTNRYRNSHPSKRG